MHLSIAARQLVAGLFCCLLTACAAHIQHEVETDADYDSPERHFLKSVPIPDEPLGRDGLPLAHGIAVPAMVHNPLSFGFSDTPPIPNAHYEIPVANDDERDEDRARMRAKPKPESYRVSSRCLPNAARNAPMDSEALHMPHDDLADKIWCLVSRTA